MEYKTIIDFWFNELTTAQHFSQSDDVDERIKSFADVHTAAKEGKTVQWRETAEGSLAEIIVLDQFSRNMFRGSGETFAQDAQVLKLAQEAVSKGFDQELEPGQRMFMYMPYMHSESKEVHREAVKLFESLGMEGILKYEHTHKGIIDQFGRYPHRNEVLGRENTPEEQKYLAEENESFS